MKQPKWIAPMLATLTEQRFSDVDWIYERKLDGIRCLFHKDGDKIQLWSRNKISQNNVFPELVAALKKYPGDFIIDGEIVAFVGSKTSFEELGNRMHVQEPSKELIKAVPVTAYIFDILYLNGQDLTKLPLSVRKTILKNTFTFVKPYKYLIHRKAKGLEYFKYACTHGWEGVIAKRANSLYLSKRSRDWLKFKCNSRQEFIICGYTPPFGSRVGFGALLLGYYKNGKLRYAGRVGTGFNTETLLILHKKMQKLLIPQSPFFDFTDGKNTIWLKPQIVGEVEFTEWTADGRLRHPSFIGLRKDKNATDVKREKPCA